MGIQERIEDEPRGASAIENVAYVVAPRLERRRFATPGTGIAAS